MDSLLANNQKSYRDIENQVTTTNCKKLKYSSKNIEKCTKVTKNITNKKQIYLIAAKEYNIYGSKENVEAFVLRKLSEGKKERQKECKSKT